MPRKSRTNLRGETSRKNTRGKVVTIATGCSLNIRAGLADQDRALGHVRVNEAACADDAVEQLLREVYIVQAVVNHGADVAALPEDGRERAALRFRGAEVGAAECVERVAAATLVGREAEAVTDFLVDVV